MERLKTIDELGALRERIVQSRDNAPTIVIPAGTCGQASGANDLIRIAKRELIARGWTEKVHLRVTGCHGWCELEPSLLIEPTRTFYPKVDPKQMPRIVEAVAAGEVVEELLYVDPNTGQRIASQDEIPFFAAQERTLLSRAERVDPIRVYNYIEAGGYDALAKVLAKGDPDWLVEEVKAAGLRGRGGAGFLTGRKWEMLSRRAGHDKVLVCNADEGDPGAYMDRSVLEGTPHSVIEGMLIGAVGTGASRGVIYVRAEYPLAIKHLMIALRQARELGLLGEGILGTNVSFEISVVKGAGAFVCGEETALIHSIEGKMGEPKQRPPFPVERGINGKPTSINNVETWANVPLIVDMGAAAYAAVGAENSSGTKIFSLVGKIRNTGLVEVPMGITVDEIVNGIGGGALEGRRIKAVQTGGPSGGCIPVSKFDLPVDYDHLAEAGSIMGSGGMIVMDDHTCMVDVAKYFMGFLKDESCGKCFTCRKGTQRMWEILDDISSGRATLDQLDLLEELALTVKDTTMCGLGQSAANPVLSTLRYFRDEFERHIIDKRCDAFVCKELVGAPCQSACPIGTEAWRYVAHISRGEYEEAYAAIRATNPFPSVCARVCDHQCEGHCRLGTTGLDPVAIRALKRFVTDKIPPSRYAPTRRDDGKNAGKKVAVVGSGPAGLTAAHFLSLEGYSVKVFEADDRPGGMLVSGVPQYRLPRDVLQKEIDALIDENITLECDTALGRDFTLDQLFERGYKAVFLALGAHRSRRLNIEGEDGAGVYPSMKFLKAWNMRGENVARGRVGIIGGGNSAIDAARVALRQDGVESVTILYRRTRDEMPAFEPEIQAALREGIKLETLVSPVKIHAEGGRIAAVELLRNELGEPDSSGRRRPVPMDGSEFISEVDTLIVAIGEQVQPFELTGSDGVEITAWGTMPVDKDTLATRREGVFAGGDVVTGPNTVVDAIAAGKKVAGVIDRYIRGEDLARPARPRRPAVFVDPDGSAEPGSARADCPTVPVEERRNSFVEVERPLCEEEARREAGRCLRCDLEFTQREVNPELQQQTSGGRA
jgi:NADH:ubiquinone oxidoreductase subunit F (NADH-binding)/NADPH-dependent glutamate synthase beta subunit-like oxidoreductase/(2Fe-2S) ferredoxin